MYKEANTTFKNMSRTSKLDKFFNIKFNENYKDKTIESNSMYIYCKNLNKLNQRNFVCSGYQHIL